MHFLRIYSNSQSNIFRCKQMASCRHFYLNGIILSQMKDLKVSPFIFQRLGGMTWRNGFYMELYVSWKSPAMVLTHWHGSQKGPSETLLPVAIQEIPSTANSSETQLTSYQNNSLNHSWHTHKVDSNNSPALYPEAGDVRKLWSYIINQTMAIKPVNHKMWSGKKKKDYLTLFEPTVYPDVTLYSCVAVDRRRFRWCKWNVCCYNLRCNSCR